MSSRVREQAGMGLVELLVAMTVMAIGIFALVAGFGSGIGAINRASKTSTAGTLADRQMEAFRRGTYFSINSIALATTIGADGRTYGIGTVVESRCPDETAPTGPTCTLNDGVTSRPVKRATVTVLDGSTTGPVLITESSTFDQSTG
ncbi:MAG: prepilin-type N-terminal cleavage/methylation domain-containing protein [Gaiellaceae bacterium]